METYKVYRVKDGYNGIHLPLPKLKIPEIYKQTQSKLVEYLSKTFRRFAFGEYFLVGEYGPYARFKKVPNRKRVILQERYTDCYKRVHRYSCFDDFEKNDGGNEKCQKIKRVDSPIILGME